MDLQSMQLGVVPQDMVAKAVDAVVREVPSQTN